MVINFVVNHVAGGWKPTDARLGGTEESVVRWSEELTKQGHEVTIYDNDTRDSYNGGGDVCINVKSSDIPPKEPTLYLTNETNATDLDLSAYKGVIWPSEWARDNIPVNNPNTFILPHGYDSESIYPDVKILKQCFYASSPDRGLDTLLEAWPKIHEAHPDATLLVTYGVSGIDLPGVICLGDADEDTMNEVYRTSEFWLHPCNGGELFGITGIKAQVAGCWPVIIPTMALEETVKYGTFTTKENFAEDTIKALSKTHVIPEHHYPDWKETALMLERIIQNVVQ
jgi:hypothetical protein